MKVYDLIYMKINIMVTANFMKSSITRLISNDYILTTMVTVDVLILQTAHTPLLIIPVITDLCCTIPNFGR